MSQPPTDLSASRSVRGQAIGRDKGARIYTLLTEDDVQAAVDGVAVVQTMGQLASDIFTAEPTDIFAAVNTWP
ncbi:hypothetical protein [Nocardiopsis kunsanensis]|uniref:hypothetical protein n=1 Tax=Nocardiopsis kunsanensis TaxID=141693 RepID=UPI000345601D|nr:hypothetical protein [Nocardiopsis kunsanensis]